MRFLCCIYDPHFKSFYVWGNGCTSLRAKCKIKVIVTLSRGQRNSQVMFNNTTCVFGEENSPSLTAPQPMTVAFLPTIFNPAVSRVEEFPSPYAELPNPVSPKGGKQRGLMNFVNEMSFSSLTRPMSLFKIVGSLKSATKIFFSFVHFLLQIDKSRCPKLFMFGKFERSEESLLMWVSGLFLSIFNFLVNLMIGFGQFRQPYLFFPIFDNV